MRGRSVKILWHRIFSLGKTEPASKPTAVHCCKDFVSFFGMQGGSRATYVANTSDISNSRSTYVIQWRNVRKSARLHKLLLNDTGRPSALPSRMYPPFPLIFYGSSLMTLLSRQRNRLSLKAIYQYLIPTRLNTA